MNTTEIAVVGLGGVGGYFGFKLAQHYAGTPVAVTYVARGATHDVVKERGLTLLSPEHPISTVRPARLVEEVAQLSEAGVILLCVKEYDLEAVCQALKPVMRPEVVVLPLMNGVDIYERIRRVLPTGIVLPACVYVASHLQQKGVVEHKGNSGRIILGNDPEHPQFAPERIVDLLAAAGIQVAYQADAFPANWTKFMFIASFGLVSARYNQPIGQIAADPHLHERARRIMQEIVAIAHRKGYGLPADIIEQTFQKARTFPFHTPTSLQLDVHSGRPRTELALFAGAIVAYGNTLGIPTEETSRIQAEILEVLAQKPTA
ncbi:MAG TPA: 2-dehydropantoate 2-reductase [Hymenobacter sp.]